MKKSFLKGALLLMLVFFLLISCDAFSGLMDDIIGDEEESYEAASGSEDLGTIVVLGRTATVASSKCKVKDDSFTYTSGSVTYTVTLDDKNYTYDAVIISETYTAADSDADFGTVTVVDGKATLDGTTANVIDGIFEYVLDDVYYDITLDSDTHTYTVEEVTSVTYTESTSYGLGSIEVRKDYAYPDGSSSGIEVVDNVFTYAYGSYIYTITLDKAEDTYSAEITYIIYTEDGSSTGLGDVTVEVASNTAVVGDDADSVEIEESGTFAYTSGAVTYLITLDSTNCVYTATVQSIVYSAASNTKDFGTFTVVTEDGVTTATNENDDEGITVTDGSFEYSYDGDYYTITLNTSSYTYTAIQDQDYTAASGSVDFGTIALTGSSAVFDSDPDTEYTLSSSAFVYTYGSVTYTIVLNSTDYTYITYAHYSGTYGHVLVATVDGALTYDYDDSYNESGVEVVFYPDDLTIKAGYVKFAIELSSSAYTYDLNTAVVWVDEVMCGYGVYTIKISIADAEWCFDIEEDGITAWSYIGDEYDDARIRVDSTGTIITMAKYFKINLETKTSGTFDVNFNAEDDDDVIEGYEDVSYDFSALFSCSDGLINLTGTGDNADALDSAVNLGVILFTYAASS